MLTVSSLSQAIMGIVSDYVIHDGRQENGLLWKVELSLWSCERQEVADREDCGQRCDEKSVFEV